MPTSTATFTSNPQAKDDLFTSTGLTEDSLSGLKLLDVIGNDLGTGNTLYSLADAKSESEARSKALSTQDAVGAVNLSTLGAKIWITAEGKVAYDASTINTAQFQSLAAGQSATDSFTYAIKLSNGMLSWATAKVQITGINDAPVIDLSSLTIDGDSSSGKVTGTLLYTDPDKGDQHSASKALSPLVSSAGAPNLSASLGQALRTTINDEGENGKGALKWNFALPSGTPKLATGQAVLANYQLSIADNHGGNSAAQDVGVLLVGTGATPKVYSVAARANLTEQAGKIGSTALDQASGTLSGNELGLEDKGALTSALVMTSWSTGAAIPSSAATVLASAITTSTVPTSKSGESGESEKSSKGGESEKSIAWQFSAQDKTFDFLAAGQTLTLAYRISSSKEEDGKSKIITLTVTGTNDAPVITNTAAALVGAVKEDTTLSATGQLSASDVDHGATQSWSVQGSATGTYGAIAVNATGKWIYTLTNTAANVQSLAAGETHTETFTVRVTDDQGAAVDQSVTVTLTGTNDAPVITNAAVALVGAVKEDITLTVSGQLSASDVDNGATQAWSIVGSAAGTYGGLAVSAATGQWTYTLNNAANVQALAAGESHTETFTVRVTDDQGAFVDQQVSVVVTGTNDAPIVAATDVTGAVTEQVTPAGNLTDSGTITFTDVDLTDAHSLSAVTPSAGALGALSASVSTDTTGSGAGGVVSWNYSVADSAVEYLAAGQTKVETFSFNVLDGQGGSVARTVEVTVTGTNDAPTGAAAAVLAAGTEDTAYTVNASSLLAGFSDVDTGDTLSVSGLAASNGTVTANANSTFTITPTANFNGAVTLNYNVVDSQGASVATTQSYTLAAVNDAPVNGLLFGQNYVTFSGDDFASTPAVTLQTNNVTLEGWFNWSGGGASLQTLLYNGNTSSQGFGVMGRVVGGQLQLIGLAGGRAFMESTDASLSANEWHYVALARTSGVFHLFVDGLEHAITNSTTAVTTPTSGALTMIGGNNVVASETFSGSIGEVKIVTTGLNAVAMGSSEMYTESSHGVVAANWRFNEGSGNIAIDSQISSTKNLTISGTPTWVSNSANGWTSVLHANEDSLVRFGALSVSDVDAGSQPISVQLSALHGVLSPADQAPALLSLGVTGFSGWGTPTFTLTGTLSGINAALSHGIYYLGAANYNGNDTLTITTSDKGNTGTDPGLTGGTGFEQDVDSIPITVAAVNDAPTGAATAVLAAGAEDTAYTVSGSSLLAGFSDVDTGDTLSVAGLTASNGTLVNNGNGTYTITPTANFNGAVTLSYNVVDGHGGSIAATQSYTLAAVNDVATISGVSIGTVTEDTTLTASGNLTVSDVDTGEAVFRVQTAVAGTYGSFSIGTSGNWTYALNNSAANVQALNTADHVSDNFTVLSQDGSASQIVGVTLTGTNDAPVLQGTQTDQLYTSSLSVWTPFLVNNGVWVTPNGASSGDMVQHTFVRQFAAAQDGNYVFQFAVDNEGSVLVDGVAIPGLYNRDWAHSTVQTVALTAGIHTVTMNALNWGGPAAFAMNITDPNNHEIWNTRTHLDPEPLILSYTENQAAMSVSPGLTLTDIDSPTMTHATVAVGAGFAAGQDVLGFANQSGISGVYDAATGVLSLSGSATQAQYQTALRSVTYSNSSDSPSTADRTINFTVDDGSGQSNLSNTVQGKIIVMAVNDAPRGAATAVLTAGTEDTAYTVSAANLLAGFSDVDAGDTLSVSGLTPSNGTLVNNGNGTYTITPTANFNGAVALSYNVVDGHGGSIAATQSYTLTPVNDLAIISGTSNGTVTEDAALTAAGTLTVSDVDTGEAHFQVQANVAGLHGTFSIDAAGQWTYNLNNAAANVQALNTGESVTDSFTALSQDGTASQVVSVNILGANDNYVPIISGISTSSVHATLASSTSSFDAVKTFSVSGSANFDVTTADVNNDGTIDIVAAGSNGPVSVLLGNGIGGFAAAKVSQGTTGYTLNSTLADFNGDGKIDILEAKSDTTNSVSVLLGDGTGLFGAPKAYSVGFNDYGVAVADFNGDGRPDIVAASNQSAMVAVLINNGAGGFNAAKSFTTTNSSHVSVTAADVSGDGKADILVTDQSSGGVSVLLGDGTGGFGVSTLSATGVANQGIAVTDFNGDGKADVVTGNSNGTVSVLLGTGGGAFSVAHSFSAGTAGTGYNISVADMNADGKMDIVTADFSTTFVSVLLGDGAGSFATAKTYNAVGSTIGVAVADVNGDGRADIVASSWGNGTVGVLLGNGGTGGVLQTSGTLSISDLDPGQSTFVAQTATAGNHGYGNFSINAAGAWSYAATNNQTAIQSLTAGHTLTDSFTVTSFDGTATQDVTVTLVGVYG